MQNVNLSIDEHFNETWILREVFKQNHFSREQRELSFLTPHTVNSEEELYFSGHTAVWSRGKVKSSAEVCYTTENPIRFAFFCTKQFLDPDNFRDNNDDEKSDDDDDDDDDEHQGIAIVDCSSLKVYSRSGESLMSAVECLINKIWITKHCILIEKDASSTIVDGHSMSMPRIFSLTHALDEMFPVLLKSQNLISFIVENEYKVINLKFLRKKANFIVML